MEDNKKLTDRKDAHLGTEDYGKFRSGAGVRKEDKDAVHNVSSKTDESRADMNGIKGRFESEELKETGQGSGIPGAEKKDNLGDAASGAGVGGNKGRGTRSRKDLS